MGTRRLGVHPSLSLDHTHKSTNLKEQNVDMRDDILGLLRGFKFTILSRVTLMLCSYVRINIRLVFSLSICIYLMILNANCNVYIHTLEMHHAVDSPF